MKSWRGHILIAGPELDDPHFCRTVVLLLQHDAQGAMGVILNRPTERLFPGAWKMIFGQDCSYVGPLYSGGPLAENSLMMLYQKGELDLGKAQSEFEPEGREVVAGVRYAVSLSEQHEVLNSPLPSVSIRFFAGYAGWSSLQLEEELDLGAWLVHPASSELIFVESERSWQKACEAVGIEILNPYLGGRLPKDPGLN